MVSCLSSFASGNNARKRGGVIMDALLDLQTMEVRSDSIEPRASGISIACGDSDPNSNLSLWCGPNH